MSSFPMILGVHVGHDSTAALVVDGTVTAAVAEERLSRRKGHLGFPWRAIPAVLALSGVEASDVEEVTFSFHSYLEAPPFLTRALLNPEGCSIPLDEPFGLGDIVRETLRQRGDGSEFDFAWPVPFTSPRFRTATEAMYRAAFAELGLHGLAISSVEHHTCHAASCYFTAPFSPDLAITADGSGDRLASTWSRPMDGSLERIAACSGDVSLGLFYSAITQFLGFRPQRHEGKVTGLAAWGDPMACRRLLADCIHYDPLTRQFHTRLRLGKMGALRTGARLLADSYMRHPYSVAVLHHCHRRLRGQRPEDVAAAAQALLEENMVAFVQDALRATQAGRVVAAGGVFANVRMNHLLAKLEPVEEFYVHPDMGDGGTALGAALHVHALRRGSWKREPSRFDPYLGPAFSEDQMERSLVRASLPFQRPPDMAAALARCVSSGLVAGRFAGRMEYGPRALGNRSILADPRVKGIHGRLNQRLVRTDFMPFAPSILAEQAGAYLCDVGKRLHTGPYMTTCFDVLATSRRPLGDACHVDGTARAQVVSAAMNPSFHQFLSCFAEITGLPAVLNTSFNVHEEPIVCTPEDALRALQRGMVDALALGPFLVISARV